MSVFFMACEDGVGVERGQLAPNFELKDIHGKTVELSSFRGKTVLLYFWADFCPSCKREFPETQEFYDKLKKQDLEVVAVNVGQDVQISKEFAQEFKATFSMLTDPQKDIAKLYEVGEKLPVNYFINAEGKIIRRINGWTTLQQVQVILNQNKPSK